MYIMCGCLFSALSHSVGVSQILIIIIIMKYSPINFECSINIIDYILF